MRRRAGRTAPPLGAATRLGAAALLLAAALLPIARAAAGSAPPGAPTNLTVDDLAHPLGLDLTDIFFAWRVTAVQRAYRIVVSTDDPTGRQPSRTEWDSGEVHSSEQAFVPYAGAALAPDSVYRWTVQTWAASGGPGPDAVAAQFETGLPTRDWTADWIRRATPDPVDANPSTSATESNTGVWLNQDEYTYARKEVTLDSSPIVRARAYVSADQGYELYVNGALAGKGSSTEYPDHQPYETDDVTSLLRPGAANAVGLLSNWQGPGKGRPEGSPGVIAQIEVLHRDGAHEVIATDGSWKVLPGAWLPGSQRNQQGDPVDYTENINGPAEPIGWTEPGFDQALWETPIVLGRPPVAPWTQLVSARTRLTFTPVTAVSVTTLANGAIVADFGEVLAGIPTVTFRHGVAGRRITMHAGYVLDAGAVSTTRGTQGTDMSYSYVERGGGPETFRPFDYLGFRYLQIDDPGEVVQAGDVVALERHTAMPETQATFSSSNATVNAVYALAAHSALDTSQEQFVDTPTREKGPFLRDGFNESQTVMAAFGDQNLTRHELLDFAQSQARDWPDGRLNAIYPSGEYPYVRDIPDFTEIYPEWVWQYWLHTGDRTLLAAVYPVIAAIAAYVARAISPTTGLVTNLPGGGSGDYAGGLVDWPPQSRYGYDVATAARTTVNELAVDVFDRAGNVAAALGRPRGDVELQQQRAATLTTAINNRLRRADGVYIDGLEPNGRPSAHASQHANAYAIAYGVVPASDEGRVAAYVASLGMAMGPQTAQELLAALALSGRPADVVTRITDAHADGWAKILAEGGTFTWEDWNPSDAQGDSMSHGWGSTVLVAIQQYLLGVTPTGPGYSTLTVAPPASGLASASGTVPTPRGPVSVTWTRSPAGAFTLDLSVPANAVATVLLPGPGASAHASPVTVRGGTYHGVSHVSPSPSGSIAGPPPGSSPAGATPGVASAARPATVVRAASSRRPAEVVVAVVAALALAAIVAGAVRRRRA